MNATAATAHAVTSSSNAITPGSNATATTKVSGSNASATTNAAATNKNFTKTRKKKSKFSNATDEDDEFAKDDTGGIVLAVFLLMGVLMCSTVTTIDMAIKLLLGTFPVRVCRTRTKRDEYQENTSLVV